MANTHLHNGNSFNVRDGHLELQVLADGGHCEVLEFAKLVDSPGDWSIALSITTLTIWGRQNQSENGVEVPVSISRELRPFELFNVNHCSTRPRHALSFRWISTSCYRS